MEHTKISRYEGQEEDQGGEQEFDLAKLLRILRKSLPYMLGILILCMLGAYLLVRYTKPLYESQSELQLDIKSEASFLGFPDMNNEASSRNVTGMSEEIELIKSKLFLTRVIKALDLDIAYYTKGKFLDDERYRNSPFQVKYLIKDEHFFNKKIFVTLLDKEHYQLSYEVGGKDYIHKYTFDQEVITPHLELTISRTEHFSLGPNQDDEFYFILRSDNALIQYFRDNLKVEVLHLNAKTIRVSITDHNPSKARILVDVLSNLYLQYTEEEKNKANNKKIEFLNTQLEETENKMENLESYFESFTIDNKTTNLTGDINRTIGFLFEIDSQRVELKKRLSKLDRLEEQVQNNHIYLTKTGSMGGKNALSPDIAEILDKLNQLYSERELLLESYNENTRAYQRKEKEVSMLKAELMKASQAYRQEIQQQLKGFDQQRQELQSSFVGLPSKGTEFNRIQRNYEQLLGFLLNLQERRIEFEIANAGTTTDFKILSSASVPGRPVSPNQLIINAIGLVAGIFFSLLFVGARYILDNKITSLQEVERLSPLPILGTLPTMAHKKAHASLVIAGNPKSAFSEAMRAIRTNMDFMAARQQKRVITVSSTVSGEGKTFVTINLAAIIAFSRKKVIVLDLDMRKPKLHLALSGENTDKGLSTLLIGKHQLAECIRPTEVPGLDFISAGPMPPNPSELVMDESFDALINKLKASYDVIVIDTPPVGLVTDGILIMKKADLPIYVFRADYSKKEYFKTLKRLSSMHQFNNLAIVLNGLNANQGYGYGYGYKDKSGYYEK